MSGYLQHDLDAYKDGLQKGSTLLDCLWCELYGSINGAEIDDQAITHAHAEYLRDKFLRGSVASPILVLAYMLYFTMNHAAPDDLVDKNLRTGYAAQIELKYFKASDEVSVATLAQVKADAVKQLDRYARDKNIAREWNLKPVPNVTGGVPGGTVELHRLLVVFHGGQVVVCEEVV